MFRARSIASIGCALVLSAYTEAAPEDPIRLNVGVGIVRDSNLLRLANDDVAEQQTGSRETSETIRRLEAGVDVDVKRGRQRVSAKLAAADNQYRRYGSLDHVSHDAGAKWDWRAGNRWNGEVGYANARALDTFSDLHRPERNLITRERAFANAGYQVHPNWTVRAGVERYEAEHSETVQRVFDRTEKSADVRLEYATTADSTVGVQAKTTEGRLPERDSGLGRPVNNNYTQNELNAVVDWSYSAATRLQGRLGYAQRSYDEFGSRDFSGIAGRLTATWAPREKTRFAASLWRELDPVEDFAASQVLATGISGAVTWTPTRKTSLELSYSYQKREHEGASVFIGPQAQLRDDKLRAAGLSFTYRPIDNIQLGVGVQNERRDSNLEGNDYRANSILATARVEF